MNLFNDYMKECEIFSDLKVPCGSNIVIRADGRNFSRLSHDLNLEKPYDQDFVNIMVDTCSEFFGEFSPSFIYTFSDEINILLDKIPFKGRVEKINSVFASFISGTFSQKILKNKKLLKLVDSSETSIKPVSFDSRIIPLNPDGMEVYFKNRQDEAWRNCLNGYAYWTLQKDQGKKEAIKILYGKKSSQLQDILFENGIKIQHVPTWQRRGVGIYRKEVRIDGYNPLSKKTVESKRWKAFEDWELPVFDGKFFKSNIIL